MVVVDVHNIRLIEELWVLFEITNATCGIIYFLTYGYRAFDRFPFPV